jgi:hypothetical protein
MAQWQSAGIAFFTVSILLGFLLTSPTTFTFCLLLFVLGDIFS